MDNLPKVSIIIPCWNAEKYIADAIGSALGQSYPNIEVIVVNDGSTDGSQTVIDSFKDRVVSIVVENGGANKARNIGIKMSSGNYVMFLDADDYIEDELLASLVDEISKAEADIAFGSWVKVKNKIELIDTQFIGQQDWKSMLISWLLGDYVPTCSVLWSRSLLEKINGWDESLKKNQDGDIVIRGLMEKPRLAFSKNGRGVYRQHDGVGRVSSASLIDNHISNSRIYDKLFFWSKNINDYEINKSIGLYAYGFASLMYLKDEIGFGDIWKIRAKEMGVTNASSTLIGLLIGRVLGLKLKIKIKSFITRLKFCQ